LLILFIHAFVINRRTRASKPEGFRTSLQRLLVFQAGPGMLRILAASISEKLRPLAVPSISEPYVEDVDDHRVPVVKRPFLKSPAGADDALVRVHRALIRREVCLSLDPSLTSVEDYVLRLCADVASARLLIRRPIMRQSECRSG
jgi:hypothetical protein